MAFVKQLSSLSLANSRYNAVVCEFDASEYFPALFNRYQIEFPSVLGNSVVSRQAEFLAGRIAAMQSIRGIGLPPATIPIDPHRAPLWPAGISGSISHTGNTALCCVVEKPLIIGIDLEKIQNNDEATVLAAHIISDAELQLLGEESEDFGWRLSLAFSAKESLFKALHPVVNQYFDFLDVAICGVDASRQQLVISLLKSLGPQCPKGRQFMLSWQRYGNQHILCSVICT